jgi:hypothetical protein
MKLMSTTRAPLSFFPDGSTFEGALSAQQLKRRARVLISSDFADDTHGALENALSASHLHIELDMPSGQAEVSPSVNVSLSRSDT